MGQDHVDAIARRIAGSSTRRGTLGFALGGWLGALGLGNAMAKKGNGKKNGRRKNKNTKPALNEFGCLDVGKACLGKDALCCSGICQGNKPKKGRNDKSRCVAHNTGGCTPERSRCAVDDADDARCNLPESNTFCFTTTGNAGFCAVTGVLSPELFCRPCQTDQDCLGFGFAPGSACIDFRGGPCDGTCAETGSRGCLPPAL